LAASAIPVVSGGQLRNPADVTIGHYIALGVVVVLTAPLWGSLAFIALGGANVIDLLDGDNNI
jgi:hypothetical protein